MLVSDGAEKFAKEKKGVGFLDSVLIISSNEQSISSFSQMLRSERLHTIDSAKSGAEGRRRISERDYDIILINSPLADEFGDTLALDAADNTDSGIVLFVKSDHEAEIESRVSQYGVFVLGKPISKVLFYKSVRLLEATRNRLKGVKHENVKLQKKIDDIRIVNRAKYILIEYLSMTEPQAHKYLEKQAMDLRITKIEVAKRLLSTYEN